MGSGRDKKKKKSNGMAKTKEPKNKQVEDIDAILLSIELDQAKKFKVTSETNVEPPTGRSNATLLTHPLDSNELILFGGECHDGHQVHMFNDLFRYKIDKNQWTRITSPNSPGPRSSHQMVGLPNGTLFMFGGEFVSPNETNFFHYKDFWSFDCEKNEWQRLDMKTPSPRSGHRMVLWKQFIVLFGGFYDVGKDVKYFDDVWIFDTKNYEWTSVNIPEPRPSPRSGCQFVAFESCLMLYGGYSKETKGKQDKGTVHSDIWILKMSENFKEIRWERKKKANGSPTIRSGGSMIHYKGKAILFGGVTDVEETEDQLESICHNDLYCYLLDSHRWVPINLKSNALPAPRFNGMLALSKNTLFLYGGTFEKKSLEHAFSDFWKLSMDKQDEWVNIIADEFNVMDCDESSEEEDLADEFEAMDMEEDFNDPRQPKEGETLKDYFQRTQHLWEEQIKESKGFKDEGKSLRKDAFDMAKGFYEEIDSLMIHFQK